MGIPNLIDVKTACKGRFSTPRQCVSAVVFVPDSSPPVSIAGSHPHV